MPHGQVQQELFSVYQVAAILGVTSDAVRRGIERGQVPVTHIGPPPDQITKEPLDGLDDLLKGRIGDKLGSIANR